MYAMHFILFLSIAIYFNPAFAAVQCVAVLDQPQSSALTQQGSLAAVTSRGTGSRIAPQLQEDLNMVIRLGHGKNMVDQLIQNELLYSRFFNKIASHLKIEPRGLNLIMPEQLNELANQIYFEMDRALHGNSPIKLVSDYLKNPIQTQSVFRQLSKEALVDKIGESLIAQGARGAFTDAANLSAEVPVVFSAATTIISGTVAVVTGLAFGMSYSHGAPADQMTFFLDPFLASLGVTSVSSTYWGVSGWLRRLRIRRNHLAIIDDPQYRAMRSVQFFPTFQRDEFNSRMATISSNSDGLLGSPETVTGRSLITFGTKSLELHSDLVHVFVDDFVKWMKIYENYKSAVRDSLRGIQSGSVTSQNRATFQFLSQVLVEAAEATHLTHEASEKVIELLTMARTELDAFQENRQMNALERNDWANRRQIIDHAIASHTTFQLSLIAVHQTISRTVSNLATINQAGTNAVIRSLGERLDGNRSEQTTVEQILLGLDELDTRLQGIRSAQPSP